MSNLTGNVNIEERECPECGAVMLVTPQYVAWCDQCNWNIRPLQPEKATNLFESLYASLGNRRSQQLFNKLQKQDSLKPALTFSKLLAFFFSVLIYGVVLVFFIVGILLIFRSWGDILRIVTIFLGIICLAFVFASVPRPLQLKRPFVTKESFPHLYTLVNEIAKNLGSAPIHGIIITPGYNASFMKVGWLQKPVVVLGYALWSVLDDQERVALIAHEVAHTVNGDLTRQFFTGGAVEILLIWYRLLIPDRLIDTSSLIGLVMTPFNFLLYGLAKLVSYVAWGLVHLLWQDSQRAEYLADYLSAQLAGTDAALTTLEKIYFSGTFSMTVQNVTLNWEHDPKDLFTELQRRVDELPARELERIRRIRMMENSRLNVTHPPTPLRVEMLKSHSFVEPQMNAAEMDFTAVNQELTAVRDDLAKLLRSSYLQSIGHY